MGAWQALADADDIVRVVLQPRVVMAFDDVVNLSCQRHLALGMAVSTEGVCSEVLSSQPLPAGRADKVLVVIVEVRHRVTLVRRFATPARARRARQGGGLFPHTSA